MLNFIIIALAVFVGIMASYAMLLLLMINKTAMKKMTKEILKISMEVTKELSEDEDFEDWLM